MNTNQFFDTEHSLGNVKYAAKLMHSEKGREALEWWIDAAVWMESHGYLVEAEQYFHNARIVEIGLRHIEYE